MTNGKRFSQSWNLFPKSVSVRGSTATVFSKPCCGLPAQVRNGERLPRNYGRCNSVYKRFANRSAKGIFEKLCEQLSADRDLEYLLIDSSIVRCHACAAGAQKNTVNNLLGRSRGGHSTKIHLPPEALANAIGFILTGGQRGWQQASRSLDWKPVSRLCHRRERLWREQIRFTFQEKKLPSLDCVKR